ncbi:MAG: alpha/beta hydrolase [Rhodopseudomonas sp.]|uniref:alpha/beta fold hydrolase n=1 Tax=Rhodopseudomonas sp. TaxID=1078 RepID=UPI00185C54B1|nr:alpha/beta hydrolase [Rhodopseudomonas sp.]NVN88837.1 alpha/beta hydrolase [Rhodopseudomonas sp.]
MMTGLLVVFALMAALAAAAATSWLLNLVLEARYPPRGIFITVDGVRLHVVNLAAANPSETALPAVLLLHGANLCLDDMRTALGDRLARRLRVIIPDRPGQGFSATGPGDISSPAYQVELIRGLAQSLETGPLIVVGHSFGGLIALRYALDDPEAVSGLVLINPTSHPRPGGLPWFQRVAEVLIGPLMTYTLLAPLSLAMIGRLTARIFRPETPPPGYPERSRLGLALMPGRFAASLREYSGLRDQLIAHVPRYSAISVPTTIVAGEADPVVPPAIHAEALAAALPRARLLRLAGAGHMAHHAHAEAIAAEVERLAGCQDLSLDRPLTRLSDGKTPEISPNG